jgi:hypothetical protein
MPIETKNKTEKASRNGRRSALTWWLSGDSLTTTPATKAPKASDTPKISAAARAVPNEIARTARMKSSREPVRAVLSSIQGISFLPTNSRVVTKTAALSKVKPRLVQSMPPDSEAIVGISTMIKTVAKSSNTSQPTAV